MNDKIRGNGLARVTMLVVEDDLHIRTLLAIILRSLGVGNVLLANDGHQAIEMMRRMRHDPTQVGAAEIDLVLCDWMMEPVDGAKLLRWIRRDRESPDRFMSFIMISGCSSQEYVTSARDLGAHQFIAKPFSINTLATHINTAVQDERGFVKTADHFGPDRRRRAEPVEVERRDPDNAAKRGVRFLKPTKRLRSKTGGDFVIDPERVAEAEEELGSWDENFLDWVSDYLSDMNEAHQLASSAEEARERRRNVDRINTVCHELRGQGGLFGYPLISTVCESLFQLTYRVTDVPDAYLKLVGEHIDTLKAIRRDEMCGDGGDLGRQLVEALNAANRNFVDKMDDREGVGQAFLRQTRSGLRFRDSV